MQHVVSFNAGIPILRGHLWHLYIEQHLIWMASYLHYFNAVLVNSLFNPKRAGTELSRFNYVNIMAADALAPYVAMTSAAMILTM